MKLAEFSVRNWQFTIVVFVMLALLGVVSWNAIPRLEDPPLDFPSFLVVAVYPGASAEDLERLVVMEVEDRLNELDDVEEITSSIRSGVATIWIEFEDGEDPDDKYAEVTREIDALRPSLPAELARLDVERASTLDVNIVQVALVSEAAPYHVLDEQAEALEDRLASVPGVREAARWGAPDRQVHVALDLGRLAQVRLPPAQVLAAIAGESADIPGGSVEAGTRLFSVGSSGSYGTPEDVADTVVRAGDGRLLRVRDVADVGWAYADSTYRARFDGKRAVFVTVNQQDGVTIGAVRDRVYAVLDGFEADLPAGITLQRAFDQSENVNHRLARLGEDFGIAIGLVALTLLPLGPRAAAIVMISIPLSLAMGLTALHWTGFTLNQLTIVGMVIALGLLVDDSIVVVENIARFRREGHGFREAAILATRQIWIAVVGATATLVLAFVPLIFLPGDSGRFIRSLPMAVVFTVLASLFVSLTIIPFLSTMLLGRGARAEGNRFLKAFDRGIHGTYAPVLDRALKHPKPTLALAALVVLASVALVPVVGFSLFPKAETPQFLVDITAPQGAGIAVTDSAARYVERLVAGRPDVRAYYTSVGRDNPTIYYNRFARQEDPRVGQVFVLLDRWDRRESPRMLDSLRVRLARYPAAEIVLQEFEQGPPIAAPIAIRIEGPSLDSLRVLAARVEHVLERTEGTRDVTNPLRLSRTDLRVAIDRDKAGLLGVPTVEIDRTVRMGLAGLPAGTIREEDGDRKEVVVRLERDTRPSPAELERIWVASPATGRLTPLAQLAELRFERAVPEIERQDRTRAVTVTAALRTGYNTDRVTRKVLEELAAEPMPAGYRWVAAGEIESRQESFAGVGGAIIVALFAILAVLILEFRTFRATFIVASVIPLGIAGGIVALLLAGQTLSFTATIGFAALIGIEIKTSILLVDLTNQLRAKGMDLEEAIRTAGEVRFLPIVLTAMTAVGGLLPLALQGTAMYAPLAWVIIGGLVSSTMLARVVTPVMYKLIAPAA